MQSLTSFIYNLTGLHTALQVKLFTTLLIILILALVRFSILRMVWRQTDDVKIRYQWKRILSFIIPVLGIIMIAALWASAFEQFGAFLGLLTAGLAIAMKDPLTNLAGWIFILSRRPFVVGDRIQLGEHSGDVIDIRLFQFTILEIGNWVDADQSTGRIIHMPNGKVFQEPQVNYSSGFEYIWNEIKVLITFESDWKKAKSLLEELIKAYTPNSNTEAKQAIKEASKSYMIHYEHLTPIVYTSVKDSGVELTIRYLCNPRRRRGTENNIWEEILLAFEAEAKIDLAYPTTRFYSIDNPEK